ncbi:MAG TPA: hypothetical protein VN408_06350 [Actinoplanes sp.]|nr:hypothetical protein [Actinoplanes sp.]
MSPVRAPFRPVRDREPPLALARVRADAPVRAPGRARHSAPVPETSILAQREPAPARARHSVLASAPVPAREPAAEQAPGLLPVLPVLTWMPALDRALFRVRVLEWVPDPGRASVQGWAPALGWVPDPLRGLARMAVWGPAPVEARRLPAVRAFRPMGGALGGVGVRAGP